jgi:hypothetical protein
MVAELSPRLHPIRNVALPTASYKENHRRTFALKFLSAVHKQCERLIERLVASPNSYSTSIEIHNRGGGGGVKRTGREDDHSITFPG